MTADSGSNERLVSISSLIKAVVLSWRAVVVASICGLIIGIAYTHVAKPTYLGTVLVAVEADTASGLAAAIGGQLGGLASLAGMNIGSSNTRKAEFISLLRSESFVRGFLQDKGIVGVVYDSHSRGFVRVLKRFVSGSNQLPAANIVMADAVEHFRTEILSVSEDKKTGMLVIAVEWTNPEDAADWANSFVGHFNEVIRMRDGENAQAKLEYLQAELAANATIEVRESVARLMESEMNAIMVAKVQRDYALRVIDPAVPLPVDRPSKPSRFLFAFLGLFVGIFNGVFYAIVRRRSTWWRPTAPLQHVTTEP